MMTTDPNEIRFPPELQSVSYWIRQLQIGAYKNFESTTAGYGSAPRYYGLLKFIEHNPGLPQSRLAECVMLDRSSLVPILDTLENEGVIERTRNPADKRLRCAHLTDRGADLVGALDQLARQHEARLTQSLDPDERTQLLALLQRVAKDLDF